VICSWIDEDEKAMLTEGSLKLIVESIKGMPSSNGISTNVLSKLENCSLPIST